MASARGSRETLARKLVPRSSMGVLRRDQGLALTPQFRGRFQRGLDDWRVAGAAAEMAADDLRDLTARRARPEGEIGVERHQDAGSAEAALQGVMAAKGRLKDPEPAGLRRQSLDGADRA